MNKQVFMFAAGLIAAMLGALIMFISLNTADKQLQLDVGFQACNTGCSEIEKGCEDKDCSDIDHVLVVPLIKPTTIEYGEEIGGSDFSFMVCNCGIKPIILGTTPIRWEMKDTAYGGSGTVVFEVLGPSGVTIFNGDEVGWSPEKITLSSKKFLEKKQIEVTLRTSYGEKLTTWAVDYITENAVGTGG